MSNISLCIIKCPVNKTNNSVSLVPAGQREAVLPRVDQLPGSQQSDRGGLHLVHPGQSHSERQGRREGQWAEICPPI